MVLQFSHLYTSLLAVIEFHLLSLADPIMDSSAEASPSSVGFESQMALCDGRLRTPSTPRMLQSYLKTNPKCKLVNGSVCGCDNGIKIHGYIYRRHF
jgi:hypothetical protein